MRRLSAPLLAAALFARAASAAGEGALPGKVEVAPTPGEGYVLVDATAASVEGEILFRSDVAREACLLRCGAIPGEKGREASFAEARRLLVEDTAILAEQKRLSLGAVDEGALRDATASVRDRIAECREPCAATLGESVPREVARRRLLVRDFLERRVSAFVEVTDEEVERERALAAARRGEPVESVSVDEVRESLVAAKREKEIARWRESAVSKARVVLPRTEEDR